MKPTTIIATTIVLLSPTFCLAAAYSVTDLGTNPLGHHSDAYGINTSGEVVGRFSQPGPQRAFLYSGGLVHDLGALGGTNPYSDAFGINDSGQVVGRVGSNSGQSAFLYSGGVMTDLELPGSIALDINEIGQIVGNAKLTSSGYDRAFLYEGGVTLDLGTLGGAYSSAAGINASGQVAGQAAIDAAGTAHAFIYSGGVMHDLGALGTHSWGRGINESGQVIGTVEVTVEGEDGDETSLRAALFANGTISDLGSLGGTVCEGQGINASGQAVGFSEITLGQVTRHAWLYSGGTMHDLNSLIDPTSGWELQNARAINDSGQITGSGLINGEVHGFLLTPIPEPSSFVLAALGLIGLVIWKRRKRRA